MSRRTWGRACALTTATGALTLLAVAPASAHVTVTPSVTSAGAYTVVTVALSHGCEGSPTTALDVQIPEQILAVSPDRSPYWTAEPTMDGDRVASMRFEATEPLPDGVRDSVELTFQIPEDLAGETLAFPTIQECEKGETAWTQVPEDGQSADDLETPAPSFTVSEATGDHHGTEAAAEPEAVEAEDSDALGIAGLVAGLLGLAAGVTALVRSKSPR